MSYLDIARRFIAERDHQGWVEPPTQHLQLDAILAYTANIPLWQEMIGYLDMPHHDSFGLEEKTRYEFAREAVDRAAKILRDNPDDKEAVTILNRAASEYSQACDAIYMLFKRTYPSMFHVKLM